MSKPSSRFKAFWESLGPGLISGAADDDPSGIGTYTVAGAQFGGAFLWAAFLTWPLMAAVQMACARVGMTSGQGLGSALNRKLPRSIMISICFALFSANCLNIGADLSAMGDGMETLNLGPCPLWIFVFASAITWATVFLRYHQIAGVLKWLALFLFAYVATVFILKPDWADVFKQTLFPSLPSGREQWGMLVAILGTTISPYLFFWQAAQEVEEEKFKGRMTVGARRGATPREIIERKFDVGVGTFFSNLVMFFIILAASLTLHRDGADQVQTSAEAAAALKPVAGEWAALLYTAGLVGTGLLAIPTLTASSAYAFANTFRWNTGLDAKWSKAKAFYLANLAAMIIALIIDFIGLNPIKALYWSAVVNGILAPFLLLAIWFVIRDPKLMAGQTSSRLGQVMVGITTAVMFAAVIVMFAS
jgi:Mn2+/Fe2+ NRAMP family transporter